MRVCRNRIKMFFFCLCGITNVSTLTAVDFFRNKWTLKPVKMLESQRKCCKLYYAIFVELRLSVIIWMKECRHTLLYSRYWKTLSPIWWECNHEWRVGKGLVGRNGGLCCGKSPVFTQIFWGNPRNFSVRKVASGALPLHQTVQCPQKPKSSLNK
jgi:hypothetical protein